MGDPRSTTPQRVPKLILWWEALPAWQQLVISFPILSVLMLVINIGPFNQPVPRSIFYGLFEGAVLAGLLAVATATERGKRR